jgi:hypothetical protein
MKNVLKGHQLFAFPYSVTIFIANSNELMGSKEKKVDKVL